MAVLADGQKFGLSSKSQTNKSVLYVKLTDSALRSLEEYLKNKAVFDARQGPSLTFSENGGFIRLPGHGDRCHTYSFGLSNEESGPAKQGRTDFLMSSNSTLTSLGSMSETLRVKASDDTFRQIESKFNTVKLENEKKSTRLLENKDKKGTSLPKPKIVKRVVPSGHVINTPSSGHSSGHVSLSPGQSSYSGLGPGRGPSSSSRPQSPMSRPSSSSLSPASSNSISQNSSLHLAAQSRPSYPNSSSSSSRPAPAPSRPPTVNTEIMKRPLRERLIHILAIRPYKKPELIFRMHKDGLKKDDKKNLSHLLREVSDCKNNVYELRRSMWNEVAEDWIFYSEQDRAALRRRKPQNLTPPGSDTGSTSSGHSPSSTNPPSPPQITNPLKRHTYSESHHDNGPIAKKKRVSNYKRDNSWDSARSPGLSHGHMVTDHSSMSVNVSPRLDMEYEKVEDDSVPDWSSWGKNQSPSRDQVSSGHVTSEQSGSESPDTAQTSSQMQPTPNKNTDFLMTYTPILSTEQRHKYKAEFNQNYAKYMKLHNVLDQVSKRFSHLEGKLKHAPKGSEEFKNVKARILQEYERNKQDKVYQEARSNFQYLHEKLAHIKKLVHDFDTAKVASQR